MPTNRIQRWLVDQSALTWAKAKITKGLTKYFQELPELEARQAQLGRVLNAANDLVNERFEEIEQAIEANDTARLNAIRDHIVDEINRLKP